MCSGNDCIHLRDINCDIIWIPDDEQWEPYSDAEYDYDDGYAEEDMYFASVEGVFEQRGVENLHSGYARIEFDEDGDLESVELILWEASNCGRKHDLNETYYYTPGGDNSDVWDWMDKTYDEWVKAGE